MSVIGRFQGQEIKVAYGSISEAATLLAPLRSAERSIPIRFGVLCGNRWLTTSPPHLDAAEFGDVVTAANDGPVPAERFPVWVSESKSLADAVNFLTYVNDGEL